MDRLQSLRVFAAVAEAESFVAGARTVGLSAPSATRGVNALEARLGVRLFTRTTRQVRLTEVGRAYLQDVREILAQLQAADNAASGAAQTPNGHLRITCPQEFGRMYIAPMVTAFLDQHSGVTAEVLMVDRIANIVEEGFDVALRIGQLPSSGLAAVRVGHVRRVVCAAPSYLSTHGPPQTPEDLETHRLISTTPLGTGPTWRFGPGGEQSAKALSRLTLSSVAATIEVARSGWGLCRVLSYQIGPDLEAGTLCTVLEAFEPDPLPVHLVHIEGRRAAAKVRSFIDFAADRLRAAPVFK